MDEGTTASSMRPETLVGLVEQSIRRNWALPALADWEGSGLTYGQVAGQLAWLRELFQICHVGPEDRIALLGRNNQAPPPPPLPKKK